VRTVWESASGPVRRVLLLLAVVVFTALGAHWEASGAGPGLAARMALHAWIWVVVVAVVVVGHRLKERWQNESLAWSVAMALLVVVGAVSDTLLA
jgi:hypothetical protein